MAGGTGPSRVLVLDQALVIWIPVLDLKRLFFPGGRYSGTASSSASSGGSCPPSFVGQGTGVWGGRVSSCCQLTLTLLGSLPYGQLGLPPPKEGTEEAAGEGSGKGGVEQEDADQHPHPASSGGLASAGGSQEARDPWRHQPPSLARPFVQSPSLTLRVR